MTRLESTAPNDSTRTRLADFAVNDSSQLSYNLYRINSSKLLWLYCLGRTMSPVNNENFETLSENIWDLHRIQYIPDGHAYITFLFLETTLVPQFLKWSLKICVLMLILTGSFHFWYSVWSAISHFKLTYKAWLITVYSLLILTPVASYASYMYVHSISRHDETSHVAWSYLILTRTVILVQPSCPNTMTKVIGLKGKFDY